MGRDVSSKILALLIKSGQLSVETRQERVLAGDSARQSKIGSAVSKPNGLVTLSLDDLCNGCGWLELASCLVSATEALSLSSPSLKRKGCQKMVAGHGFCLKSSDRQLPVNLMNSSSSSPMSLISRLQIRFSR